MLQISNMTHVFFVNYLGNPKEPKEPNMNAKSLYSETVPNTSSAYYGLRTKSPNTNCIQRLERTGHNLRKTDKELLYYD